MCYSIIYPIYIIGENSLKYKLIIIFFNFFVIISFAAVFFLPLTVLGYEYAKNFWISNWYLPLVFAVLIAVFNIFFLKNWSVLKYVEDEDWAALKPVLEDRIYSRSKNSYTNVKLLINAYYLTSDIESLFRLENHIEKNNPSVYRKTELMFVSGRLLKNNSEETEKYLETKISNGKEADIWIEFNYSFILVLQQKFDKASELLPSLINKSKDKIVTLCSIYLLFLASGINGTENTEKLRTDFIAETNREKIDRIIQKGKGDLHVLFLTRIIEQAVDWAYAVKEPA